jgi:hypothetical protein
MQLHEIDYQLAVCTTSAESALREHFSAAVDLVQFCMPLIDLKVKHGTTLDEARKQLESAVTDVQRQFAVAVQRVTWNADRTAVNLTGPGVVVDLRIDTQHVHATGDIPILGALLGSNVGQRLSQGIRGILSKNFPKGLPDSRKT